jgi:glucose-1-phosphatase
MNKEISHLVFDLGGVIIELRGLPILNEWVGTDYTAEEVWNKWLTSAAPRAFEAGKIDKNEFASRIIDELYLNIGVAEFLDYFTTLPIAPFQGAIEMLEALKNSYKTALFSNSNEIHWERKMSKMKLGSVFNFHFASHLMGKVKPDAESFEYVIYELAVSPSQILFFDDNQLNVEAARNAGMRAERVTGLQELQKALKVNMIQW